ncbi:endopeptidase La [Candidatus Sumerlaeota bacterium]|nr:endopeptidase La [Candidatus Sumerlaeota bacterium]
MENKSHTSREVSVVSQATIAHVSNNDEQLSEAEMPEVLPILPIDNIVVYPFMIAPIIVGDENSRIMIECALREDRMVGIFTRKENAPMTNQDFEEIYEVGTAAAILKMLKIPDGTMRLLLHGVRRVKITEHISSEPYMKARIEAVEETSSATREIDAIVSRIRPMINEIVQLANMPEDMAVAAANLNEPGKLADLIASNLNLKLSEQQEILEHFDIRARLKRILEIMNRELDKLQLGNQIQQDIQDNLHQNQREYYLREQMKAIQRELGEDEEASPELEEIRERLAEKQLPEYARETAERELSRLEMMPPSSGEYSVVRTYLDWIVDLPWMDSTDDNIDIKHAQKILDEDHYGLERIKERILEHLSVIKIRKELRGPILCFAGPPGVGKTSLGRSIAHATGRKFHRIALGGMHDESEIRGHRRTYIGAMPGRVLKGLKECGSNNPLFMLDEVDKLGQDFRGDPASALLEVLDPEQNFSFTDNYLDMAFDLSKVMFVTTANMLDTIPGPLRDRMEVIQLSGYTIREKTAIAKKYLVPRQISQNGLKSKDLKISDSALEQMIDNYTREAGLRNLERSIGSICRKVARRHVEGDETQVRVNTRNLEDFLGPRQYFSEVADRTGVPGVCTGLAWTPVGGEILFIEAAASRGKGNLILTGQLGDVMKESACAAVSYLKTQSDASNRFLEFLQENDLHIHIPAGATPKDGPSAGIALCTAIASLALNQPIKPLLAMTGEITITGKVLPIGGLKEKVLGAARAGIREIIMPTHNQKDMEDVPVEIRNKIRFHFVDKVPEVARIALPQTQGFDGKRNGSKR